MEPKEIVKAIDESLARITATYKKVLTSKASFAHKRKCIFLYYECVRTYANIKAEAQAELKPAPVVNRVMDKFKGWFWLGKYPGNGK